MNKLEVCTMFGCTIEQLNQQYAANARTFRTMHAKAVATGKKVNRYTAEELDAMASKYESITAADPISQVIKGKL